MAVTMVLLLGVAGEAFALYFALTGSYSALGATVVAFALLTGMVAAALSILWPWWRGFGGIGRYTILFVLGAVAAYGAGSLGAGARDGATEQAGERAVQASEAGVSAFEAVAMQIDIAARRFATAAERAQALTTAQACKPGLAETKCRAREQEDKALVEESKQLESLQSVWRTIADTRRLIMDLRYKQASRELRHVGLSERPPKVTKRPR